MASEDKPWSGPWRVVSGLPDEVERAVNTLYPEFAVLNWTVTGNFGVVTVTAILLNQSEIRKLMLAQQIMPPGMVRH